MSAEAWFIERCIHMPVGGTEAYPPGGYTVFRFKDEWWVLWMFPLHGVPVLGKELLNMGELLDFLGGNNSTGTDITLKSHVAPYYPLLFL